MAEFLEKYLEAGLSQIFVIGYKYNEERSGFQNEHTRETIVAYDGNCYVRSGASESRIYAPPGSYEFFLFKPLEITEAEYKELSAGQTRSDTPEALEALQNRKIAARERAEASAQLDAIKPKCPKCGKKLAYRNGPRGRFWGCPSYPACKGTANFTAEHIRLFEIASKLS
jgi:Topoisomerase DNA binding C4 zinc finger